MVERKNLFIVEGNKTLYKLADNCFRFKYDL